MECCKKEVVAIISTVVSLLLLLPNTQGWGDHGHTIVCKIAQCRLNDVAGEAVKKLLPEYAENDLGSLCVWADYIKRDSGYRWSSTLHFADTPDFLCNFNYQRDCGDLSSGEAGQCVVGAINNYTKQLLNYGTDNTKYNLTEALLFLSHFIGDIHQPLHCGFVSDLGGNRIEVNWYSSKKNLHRVWDDNIIEKAEERFYDSNMDDYVNAIQHNITREWVDEVKEWENCSPDEVPCPDVYATESIGAACQWAYNGVKQNEELEDGYFLSRLPIVNLRLAQAGVRLAATLNHIFDSKYYAVM